MKHPAWKIELNQEALEQAIIEYIAGTAMGMDLSTMNVAINLIAGRGENGMRAEITLVENDNDQPQLELPEAKMPSDEDEPEAEAGTEQVIEPFDFDDDED